jgi:hypothetical protein
MHTLGLKPQPLQEPMRPKAKAFGFLIVRIALGYLIVRRLTKSEKPITVGLEDQLC